jgi:hypothetical protein
MSKTLLERMTAAREALATALAASSAGGTQVAELEQSRASIASQLGQSEAQAERDPTDETTVTRLGTLREQQRLIDRKIAQLQAAQLHGEDSQRIALSEALHAAMETIVEAAKPTLHRVTEWATAAIAPFYAPGAKLELAVQRSDALLSLKAFVANCGHAGPEQMKPERALRLLDALIGGSPLPWTWPGLNLAPEQQTPPQAAQPTPAATTVTATAQPKQRGGARQAQVSLP